MANTTDRNQDKKEQSLVGQAGTAVHQAADSATTAVGSGMESLAGKVRDNLPREGMVGSAACAVASTLESGGQYLKEKTPGDMLEDVTNLLRKNPMTAVLIGLGVGFLIARMMKR